MPSLRQPTPVARQSTKPPTSEVSPRNMQHQPSTQLLESLQIAHCRQSAKPPKPTLSVFRNERTACVNPELSATTANWRAHIRDARPVRFARQQPLSRRASEHERAHSRLSNMAGGRVAIRATRRVSRVDCDYRLTLYPGRTGRELNSARPALRRAQTIFLNLRCVARAAQETPLAHRP